MMTGQVLGQGLFTPVTRIQGRHLLGPRRARSVLASKRKRSLAEGVVARGPVLAEQVRDKTARPEAEQADAMARYFRGPR